MFLLAYKLFYAVQEGYWRAVLFGEHVDRRRSEGKTFDENAKSETTASLQESLMRLFAVSHLQRLH